MRCHKRKYGTLIRTSRDGNEKLFVTLFLHPSGAIYCINLYSKYTILSGEEKFISIRLSDFPLSIILTNYVPSILFC